MMQKSALRTTLLLAFLSTAPMSVAAPSNNNSTEEAACQLLVANMDAEDALDKALKKQEEDHTESNPNAGSNPESNMGLKPVVQKHWPVVFDLYQKVFGKLDTSNPDALYTTFLAQSLNTGQVALDEKVKIEDLQNGLKHTEQYPNSDKNPTLNYNCSTDFLKQMLAVANDLRKKNGASFQQGINEILAEYSREDTTNCLAGLNARLFQPIVGGIQAYLRTVCVYYCKVLDAEREKSDAKKHWPNLQADYEKIFGAFNPQAQNTAFLNFITNDINTNDINTMKKKGQQEADVFLENINRVNRDLNSKYPDSYAKAINDAAYDHDWTQIKEAPERLSMTLFKLALGCMKHQLSKTFGNKLNTILDKRKPRENPKPTPMPRTLLHTPPKTKPRTIFPITPKPRTPTGSRHAKDKKAALPTPQQTPTNKFLKYQQDGLDQMLAQRRK